MEGCAPQQLPPSDFNLLPYVQSAGVSPATCEVQGCRRSPPAPGEARGTTAVYPSPAGIWQDFSSAGVCFQLDLQNPTLGFCSSSEGIWRQCQKCGE